MPPHVLITRPRDAAEKLAATLRERWGNDVSITLSPLIAITYRDDALELEGVTRLIFTSRHGVKAYARLSKCRDIPCFCVGSATATAATAIGLQATSAGGNADQMVKQIITEAPEGQCLHLHGAHVTGDVAEDLMRAGIRARAQIVYDQPALPLSGTARILLSREEPIILPLYSPRSAKLLFGNCDPVAPLWIAAISATVAEAVPERFRAQLMVAERPDGESIIDVLDRLCQNAIRVEARQGAK
jgi:uroporphyrinogen-III synthase